MDWLKIMAAKIIDTSRLTNIPQNGQFGNDQLDAILKVVYFALGIIAVVMLIIGGIMYTTSNGDAAQVARAKNTIVYTIVGVVVLVSATAIIGFVLEAI